MFCPAEFFCQTPDTPMGAVLYGCLICTPVFFPVLLVPLLPDLGGSPSSFFFFFSVDIRFSVNRVVRLSSQFWWLVGSLPPAGAGSMWSHSAGGDFLILILIIKLILVRSLLVYPILQGFSTPICIWPSIL